MTGTAAAAAAFWAVAAAQHGNSRVYDTAVGGLLNIAATSVLYNRTNHQRQFHCPIAGFILRGLLGMHFAADGIHLRPSVPAAMPGKKTINGIHYRRSILNITIDGTGNMISAMTLDGNPADPFIPSNLEGEHHIAITMADVKASGKGTLTPDNGNALPPPPAVEWTASHEAAIMPAPDNGATCPNFVYLNGVLTDELTSHTYSVPSTPNPVNVQIVNIESNRWISYSSAPHLCIPEGKCTEINLASVTRGGTKIIQDKKLAAKFVESDRWRNRNITFSYTAPHTGYYLIDVHYISGLGIVNPRRRSALRSLSVNGTRQGIFVFPQHTPANRDAESAGGWQEFTAFTNPLKVHLNKGENQLALKLYQPTPVYIDPTANTIVADFIRIIQYD